MDIIERVARITRRQADSDTKAVAAAIVEIDRHHRHLENAVSTINRNIRKLALAVQALQRAVHDLQKRR